LLHVRPLGFTDFIASAGTAQWGQVTWRGEHIDGVESEYADDHGVYFSPTVAAWHRRRVGY
ncbi:hypothetical protein VDQ48_21550, partial [Xanthomonas campestris pv. campestris]|nr:hypothetical protein [Xanthomonas campestris pv. campestris]